MKCSACKKNFRGGDKLIPVLNYVTNFTRGDFVSPQPQEFVHLAHLTEILKPETDKKFDVSAEVKEARKESHSRYESNDFACRFCGHAISSHNRMEGCEHCRCAASAREASPTTDSELDASPLQPDQHRKGR